MASLKNTGRYEIDEETRKALGRVMRGGFCSEEETARTIRETFRDYGYVCDPHTAVAVKVFRDRAAAGGCPGKTVVVSTASPYKFGESVLTAIKGREYTRGLGPFELIGKLREIGGRDIPAS
jgi:threonine synthase